MRRDQRVTIVGGGVAGLAAGVILARRGIGVRVLEAREKVGGCCSNTEVGGYAFHDGAVYLGLPEVLDAAFARLGLDRERLLPLRSVAEGYTATFPDGSVVSMAPRRLRMARAGARALIFDDQAAAFVARWRPLLRLFADDLLLRPFSAWRLLSSGWRELAKLRGTLADELCRAFSEEAVRSALAGFMLYTGATADRLPASAAVGLASVVDRGTFLPEGGMGRVPSVLQEALRQSGGEIETGTEVSRIVTIDGRAAGVEVRGHALQSDAVLSTVSGMATARLLPLGAVPRALRRRTASLPRSHSAVSVQLGLRNRIDVPSHSNAVLPLMPEHRRVFDAEEADRWINWAVPTITVPELAPPGGSIVEMFCPTLDGTAGEPEEAVAERAIAALARIHRLDVVVRRVRGPAHFRDAMRLFEGALYGVSPAVDPRKLFPHRTTLRGLYLAGQTTYPGMGVNLAMLSGVIAGEAVLADLARSREPS
jgi:phytoene dehydrogenase-like protein